ncbi:MAG TPA: hypothetical protein VEJ16_14135 [Alphaproteobacteria bacterium]|nr:hypothetical protein [Alphaproteobacteria bacterium]
MAFWTGNSDQLMLSACATSKQFSGAAAMLTWQFLHFLPGLLIVSAVIFVKLATKLCRVGKDPADKVRRISLATPEKGMHDQG